MNGKPPYYITVYLLPLYMEFFIYYYLSLLKDKNMNLIYPYASIKKVKELIALLEPYAVDWSDWTKSGACILNQKEITIIQNYLLTGSHSVSSVELNLTIATSASILRKTKMRLKWNLPQFQAWQTERMLEELGLIKYESELDRFLNSPLIFLPMPQQLKIKLGFSDLDTIGELLSKYSEGQIKRFWFFDAKNFKEFKVLLEKNNCLHLLR